MSREENEAVIRRLVEEVWNRGQLGLLDELCAPDGPAPSQERLKSAVRVYRSAFPDLRVVIEDLVAGEEVVMYRWTAGGTHRGRLTGRSAAEVVAGVRPGENRPGWLAEIAPAGRRITIEGANLHHFRQGRITSSWLLIDRLHLLHQLGALPLPRREAAG